MMQKIWKENSEEDWKAKKMSKTMNIVKNCVNVKSNKTYLLLQPGTYPQICVD